MIANIITINDIKQYENIVNLDEWNLIINKAQMCEYQYTIGDKLLQDILANPLNYVELLEENFITINNENKVFCGLKKLLVYQTLVYYIENENILFTQMGVRKPDGENSTIVSNSKKYEMITAYKANVLKYEREILEYLQYKNLANWDASQIKKRSNILGLQIPTLDISNIRKFDFNKNL